MMRYATVEELATFLGVDQTMLPADIGNILDICSRMIDKACLMRADTKDPAVLEVLKEATLLQAQYIVSINSADVTGMPTSWSAGSFSMSMGQDANGETINTGKLASRAKILLFTEGLLFRGVRLR